MEASDQIISGLNEESIKSFKEIYSEKITSNFQKIENDEDEILVSSD